MSAALALALLAPVGLGEQPSSGELARDLARLRVVGSVLYVAAHPDDENTRLLAWAVGERGLDATYLSLTRGGGGQNLIGTEQAELLDVVRTGELLAARRIDGAGQRFTRARDFGYSKSAEETLATWGHDEILSDVVRAIRELRPDVIVTRFGPTDDTHGHHVASAILAAEAYEKAADPGFVTAGLAPWRADRVLRNVSAWRIDPTTDTSGWLSVDVGGYDALTGRSWGEIAADSRTMHKSQGFGSAPSVGAQREYFTGVAGNVPELGADPFGGIALDWSRFPEAAKLDRALARAEARFDPRAPERALPDLARAHALIAGIDAGYWGPRKQAELERAMAACAGLWLTARAESPSIAPGGAAKVALTAVARTGAPVVVRRVAVEPGVSADGSLLARNVPWTTSVEVALPTDFPVSRPRWLAGGTDARYEPTEGPSRVAADTPPSLNATFDVEIAGRAMAFTVPVQRAWTDPVAGERLRDVEVLPSVTATFGARARFVPVGVAAALEVTLRADAPASGVLRLAAPDGSAIEPAEVPFALTADAPEQAVPVRLPAGVSAGLVVAEVEVGGVVSSFGRAVIDYPHLPQRTVLRPATLRVVPVAIDRGPSERIGYLPGPGDEVAPALRDLGYAVDVLDPTRARDFAGYDAIVVGIRAFNTDPALLDARGALLAYVAGGGQLVVQYQTSTERSPLPAIGPAPLTIGRGRVTEETAALTPIDPAHPVLNTPNPLTAADFDGWVQERGLYFASSWDPIYQPVFRASDAGGEPLEGGLLIARHGRGVFVYTGLAFFRQLPAGVPGAARLLANVLALETAQ